jgi:hypothetical protein
MMLNRTLHRRAFLRSLRLAAAASVFPLAAADAAQPGAGNGLRLEDFGGRSAPGHDNGDAFRRAFAAAETGATVTLGPGLYEVASAPLLAQGAIRRPPGVALIGAGRGRSAIRVTGRSVINHLFSADDSTNVLTRGIHLIGNGVKDESAPYAGGLMSAVLTGGATADMADVMLVDCDVENFASAAWVRFENLSTGRVIRRCGATGCNWRSMPGTAPGAGSITVPGFFLYYYAMPGRIEDVLVADQLMDAAHIKGGIALVGNVAGGSIRVDELVNAGLANADLPSSPEGPGAYAIMLYGKPSGAPHGLTIAVGNLANAYSVGIYSAGGHDLDIHIGHASGQRDTRDGTLLKGILAIGGGRNITARIDQVEDSNRVVMLSVDGGLDRGAEGGNVNVNIQLGVVRSRPGARDVTIEVGASAWAGGVRISGARSGPALVGVDLRTTDRFGLQDVDLSGLTSAGATYPVSYGGVRQPRLRRVGLPR